MYSYINLRYNIYDIMMILDINIPSYSLIDSNLSYMMFNLIINIHDIIPLNLYKFKNYNYYLFNFPITIQTISRDLTLDFEELYDKDRI